MSTTSLKVVSLGLESFDEAVRQSGASCLHLDWRPPAGGDTEIVDILLRIETSCRDASGASLVEAANAEAFSRIRRGQPVLKRVRYAHDVLPGMTKYTINHAGPDIAWKDMCGPMRGAYIGAIKYEGLAQTDEEAIALMDSGAITYGANHSFACVGPMTGMISYSMPLLEVENTAFGNKAYSTFNEGIGKVMRFGANGPDVIERLRWLEKELAPALDAALLACGGVNLKNIMTVSLAMGDEMHQRNVAASLNFFKAIAGELTAAAQKSADPTRIVEFIAKKNEQFFLNLAMASCKSILDAARDIPYSTVLTAMSRNGVNFGINVSGLGSQWFTAPCLKPKALYFPGYSEADANPDMGDSAIVECYGIGGFAMGSAPAVTRFVGADGMEAAAAYTHSMGKITCGPNPDLAMPNLDFEGIPTGIDIRKVVATGILPVINTGVAHKEPGVGQVGAGIVNPPMDIMLAALRAFADTYCPKDARA